MCTSTFSRASIAPNSIERSIRIWYFMNYSGSPHFSSTQRHQTRRKHGNHLIPQRDPRRTKKPLSRRRHPTGPYSRFLRSCQLRHPSLSKFKGFGEDREGLRRKSEGMGYTLAQTRIANYGGNDRRA